jgi:sigma-E factor negative regulatory protein RseC
MHDIGTIIAVQGEKAQIKITSEDGCAKCALKDSCHSGENIPTIWALNPKNGMVGNQVVVELRPQAKILSATLIFILPLLGLFFGYFIAFAIWGGRDYPVLGAFLGLVIFFGAVRIFDRLLSKNREMQPMVTHIFDR